MTERAVKAVQELASGHTVTVTPISALFARALEVQAAKRHPKPALDPFRRELKSKIGGAKLSDDATTEAFPEYQAALQRWVKVIQYAKMGLVLDTTVDHPDKVALIEQHQSAIKLFRDAVDEMTGAILVSDWVCVLFIFLATEEKEIGALYALAVGATPLSDGEISDGLAYFR